MTGLNIESYDDTNEDLNDWHEAGRDEKQMAANIDTAKTDGLNQNRNLFTLARTIAYRADSRRRFSRASSII